MSVSEKNARIASRMESVGTIRTIPSRSATCAAMVLLPTPVAPPMSTITGLSSAAMRFQTRYRCRYRCSPPSASAVSTRPRSSSTSTSRCARLQELPLHLERHFVRPLGRQPRGRERRRQQALGERDLVAFVHQLDRRPFRLPRGLARVSLLHGSTPHVTSAARTSPWPARPAPRPFLESRCSPLGERPPVRPPPARCP